MHRAGGASQRIVGKLKRLNKKWTNGSVQQLCCWSKPQKFQNAEGGTNPDTAASPEIGSSTRSTSLLLWFDVFDCQSDWKMHRLNALHRNSCSPFLATLEPKNSNTSDCGIYMQRPQVTGFQQLCTDSAKLHPQLEDIFQKSPWMLKLKEFLQEFSCCWESTAWGLAEAASLMRSTESMHHVWTGSVWARVDSCRRKPS